MSPILARLCRYAPGCPCTLTQCPTPATSPHGIRNGPYSRARSDCARFKGTKLRTAQYLPISKVPATFIAALDSGGIEHTLPVIGMVAAGIRLPGLGSRRIEARMRQRRNGEGAC